MTDSNTTISPPSPEGGWDIFRPLLEPEELKAVPCIKNKPGEVLRVHLTGFDRPDVPCVKGRLIHVVHGVLGGKPPDPSPATLIVFEWKSIPTCSHRFRQVDIEIIFAAAPCTRPDELSEADAVSYTPQVKNLAPANPIKSFKSTAQVTSDWTPEFRLSFGLPPYLAFTPGISHKISNTETRTYCRFIAGTDAFDGCDSGEPNAVTWTLFENSSQKSGVQEVVRTAVLVVRPRDDHGPFIATVKTRARVAFWHDVGEKFKDLVGLVPVDDPVVIDPGRSCGAVVVEGRKNGVGESPCDEKNLGDEDLERFLMKDEEWAAFGATGPVASAVH